LRGCLPRRLPGVCGGDPQRSLAAVCTVKAVMRPLSKKRTAVTTSRDLVKHSAESLLKGAAALSFEQLHASTRRWWKERGRSEVEIEGDDKRRTQ